MSTAIEQVYELAKQLADAEIGRQNAILAAREDGVTWADLDSALNVDDGVAETHYGQLAAWRAFRPYPFATTATRTARIRFGMSLLGTRRKASSRGGRRFRAPAGGFSDPRRA